MAGGNNGETIEQLQKERTMKKYFLLSLFVASLVCRFSYAQDVINQKIQKDQDQLKTDYQKKTDHDLKMLGKKIKRLQHRTDAQVNADLSDATKKLEAQKAEADQKLKALENSTGDAWKDLRKGMDDALTDLKTSVDSAAKQFAAKPTPANP
jgi:hypothetical protein